MKRQVIEFCFLILALIIVGGILFPVLTRHHDNRKQSCHGHLLQISLAIAMYSQDYDEKLPPVIFPGKTVGWVNGLQPYVKSYWIFQCPSEKNPMQNISMPHKSGFTDYWMNSNLSGIEETNIPFSNEVIISGDGDGGSSESTASYSIDQLPEYWRTSLHSPAKRHLDGANYAFVDGHVKWLKPEQVSQLSPSKKNPVYTFSIQ